jgi:hypothetical protein
MMFAGSHGSWPPQWALLFSEFKVLSSLEVEKARLDPTETSDTPDKVSWCPTSLTTTIAPQFLGLDSF